MTAWIPTILRPFPCPHSFAIQSEVPVDSRPPSGVARETGGDAFLAQLLLGVFAWLQQKERQDGKGMGAKEWGRRICDGMLSARNPKSPALTRCVVCASFAW